MFLGGGAPGHCYVVYYAFWGRGLEVIEVMSHRGFLEGILRNLPRHKAACQVEIEHKSGEFSSI